MGTEIRVLEPTTPHLEPDLAQEAPVASVDVNPSLPNEEASLQIGAEKIYKHTLGDGTEVSGTLEQAGKLCPAIGKMAVKDRQFVLENADLAQRMAERGKAKRQAEEAKVKTVPEKKPHPEKKLKNSNSQDEKQPDTDTLAKNQPSFKSKETDNTAQVTVAAEEQGSKLDNNHIDTNNVFNQAPKSNHLSSQVASNHKKDIPHPTVIKMAAEKEISSRQQLESSIAAIRVMEIVSGETAKLISEEVEMNAIAADDSAKRMLIEESVKPPAIVTGQSVEQLPVFERADNLSMVILDESSFKISDSVQLETTTSAGAVVEPETELLNDSINIPDLTLGTFMNVPVSEIRDEEQQGDKVKPDISMSDIFKSQVEAWAMRPQREAADTAVFLAPECLDEGEIVVLRGDGGEKTQLNYFEEAEQPAFLQETATTLQEIKTLADKQDFTETFAQIASLIEHDDPRDEHDELNEIVEIIRELSAEINPSKNTPTLVVAPEFIATTDSNAKLLKLLKLVGYENPEQALSDFMQHYDIEFLSQIMRYLTYLKNDDERKEFIKLNGLSKYKQDDDFNVINIGRAVMRLIGNTVEKLQLVAA